MILTVNQAKRFIKQAEQHFLVKLVEPSTKMMCMQIGNLLIQDDFYCLVSADSVTTFNTDGSATIITKPKTWNIKRVIYHECIFKVVQHECS